MLFSNVGSLEAAFVFIYGNPQEVTADVCVCVCVFVYV